MRLGSAGALVRCENVEVPSHAARYASRSARSALTCLTQCTRTQRTRFRCTLRSALTASRALCTHLQRSRLQVDSWEASYVTVRLTRHRWECCDSFVCYFDDPSLPRLPERSWHRHAGLNCYRAYATMATAATLEACKEACIALPGCTAISVSQQGPFTCYTRTRVNVQECERDSPVHGAWDTYLLAPPSSETPHPILRAARKTYAGRFGAARAG